MEPPHSPLSLVDGFTLQRQFAVTGRLLGLVAVTLELKTSVVVYLVKSGLDSLDSGGMCESESNATQEVVDCPHGLLQGKVLIVGVGFEAVGMESGERVVGFSVVE